MAYSYRLETVLRVRKNLEEQAQYRLAQEINTLERERGVLRELNSQRQLLVGSIEESKSNTITAGTYRFYTESLEALDHRLAAQRTVISRQEGVVSQVRAELGKRVQERQVVVKMKERDYKRYLQEMARKEQNENDEMASLRYGRGYGQ